MSHFYFKDEHYSFDPLGFDELLPGSLPVSLVLAASSEPDDRMNTTMAEELTKQPEIISRQSIFDQIVSLKNYEKYTELSIDQLRSLINVWSRLITLAQEGKVQLDLNKATGQDFTMSHVAESVSTYGEILITILGKQQSPNFLLMADVAHLIVEFAKIKNSSSYISLLANLLNDAGKSDPMFKLRVDAILADAKSQPATVVGPFASGIEPVRSPLQSHPDVRVAVYKLMQGLPASPNDAKRGQRSTTPNNPTRGIQRPIAPFSVPAQTS